MASDDEVEQLERQLAAARRKRALKEEQERIRKASQPQELVPASPSPRKKPRPDASLHLHPLPRVAQPSFFDRPQRDRKLEATTGTVELLSRPRESKFSSHMSAVPKSLADQMAEQKSVAAAQSRRAEQQKASRSSGFFDLPSSSKSTLMQGKTGHVSLFEKDREREKRRREEKRVAEEKERERGRREKGKGKEKERETHEAADLLRRAAAGLTGGGGGGIGRPAPKPASHPSASTSRSRLRSASPDPPRRRKDDEGDLDITGGPKRRSRNKDGTVIEEIELGPREFKPPKDDPTWEKVEPYSGIKLRKRLLPHAVVDTLLDGRYHLTPSQIYSLARIDSRQRVDLDPEAVDADWVVIGVLAQKGEVRFLNSNPYGGKEPKKEEGEEGEEGAEEGEADEDDSDGDKGKNKKGKSKAASSSSSSGQRDSLYSAPTRRKRAQKYLRFELVDFSSARESSSGTGRLSVMLVEADSVDKHVDEEDGNEVNVYKGQSGGAYEKFWKETPGAVVAILNPVFLPHNNKFPTYTLKPTSADSMVVIGRADHLSFCDAITREGKPCGSWVDDRTGKVCDYHVKRAIQRTGNSRPETYANTASLSKQGQINLADLNKSFAPGRGGFSSSKSASHPSSASSSSKAKPLAGPAAPSSLMLHGTAVHVSTGAGRPGSGTLSLRASNVLPPGLGGGGGGLPGASRGGGSFISGVREGPSVSEEKKRLKRRAEEDKRARRELRELVRADRGKTNGGELVRAAGRAMGKDKEKEGRGKKRGASSEEEREEEEEEEREGKRRRSVLSGKAARMIGFDPTAKVGEVEKDRSKEGNEVRSLLEAGLTDSQRAFNLSAPPGPKVRSGVVLAGPGAAKKEAGQSDFAAMLDPEPEEEEGVGEEDELVIEGGAGRERLKLSLRPPPPTKA
ncbi:hypothetical protein JCM8097_006871 [Rhodosporidiobolus ruineniae]